MMSRQKEGEGIVRYPANLNQMIDEHMMGSAGLIGYHGLPRGWKRKATQDYEQFWGLARPPPIRGHAKDIATQMAGITYGFSEDYRLPFGNR